MYIQSLTGIFAWHRIPRTEKAVGWTALGACILAGSTGITFASALAGALSPLSMLFISEALAMLFTVLSFGLFPILRKLRKIRGNLWMPILTIGVCNSVIAPLLAFTGLRMTSPVNAELFIRAEDFFLVLLAVMVLGERLRIQHLVGALFVFAGVLTVTLQGFSADFVFSRGDMYILLAAGVYAFGGIIYKKNLHHIEPELVIFCRTCTALGLFFLASPFMHHTLIEELQHFPPELFVALLGYGFAARFLNLFCFYEALDRLPVRTVSLLLNLGIITSIAFARLYLGTSITWYHLVGAALILAGSMFMEFRGFHRKDRNGAAHLKHKLRAHV